MIQGIYHPDDLNLPDFEAIGLARDGKVLLDEQDMEALLAGRRTAMMELKDLYFDGFHISSLNAKLSLADGANNQPVLLIHPLYRKPLAPDYLTNTEAEQLEKGELPNLAKRITDGKGDYRSVLVEFDQETNEYMITDSSGILAPDMVNGEHLSLDQKERYRKGKEVELEDGTSFQYTGTEREGLRSNKIALVASLIVDGGLSFMLYQGLNALFGKKHGANAAQLSDGYREAFSDMKRSEGDPMEWLKLNGQHPDKEYGRGYGRGGTSR